MLLNFAFHTFCLFINCYPTYPEVKVQQKNADEFSGSDKRSGPSWRNFSLDVTSPPFAFTKGGWVEGYIQKTILGRNLAAFQGIRYAQSPEGRLRFRDPVPNPPWRGTYRAIKKAPICLQLDYAQMLRVHGQEDCLFLNVYTPTLPTLDNPKSVGLPVIVFIHGGGFISGTSADYGPAYFLNRDIVFVTINYRLGVLGFFSSGDEFGSGNWGLKDQLLALKWVKTNIKYFGGDPAQVTIMGVSAGATSVGLHVVSKRSVGLFQSAICESGSSLENWAVNNETFENSREVASLLGCPTSSSKIMMECMRTSNPNWIVGQSLNTWKLLILARFSFGPVIERRSPTAFLVEHPRFAYQNKRVPPIPMIIGLTKDEGSLFAASMYLFPGYLRRINKEWNSLIPYVLAFDKKTNDTNGVSKKIKDFYLNGKDMTFWNRKEWVQMFGDRVISQGVYDGMQQHSAIAETYGYIFNYEGETSVLDLIGLNGKDWGVSHADDQIYLMNSTSAFTPLTVGTTDYKVSEYFVNMWTNFATKGKPYYEIEQGSVADIWEPIEDIENLRILDINETPSMIQFPSNLLKNIKFWKSLDIADS